MSVNQTYYQAAPHVGTVFKRAGLIAGEIYSTPASWKGRTVEFAAQGVDIYILFGNSVADLTNASATAVSSLTSNTLEGNNASMPLLAATGRTARRYILGTEGANELFFKIVGSADSGFWAGYVADHGRGVPG